MLRSIEEEPLFKELKDIVCPPKSRNYKQSLSGWSGACAHACVRNVCVCWDEGGRTNQLKSRIVHYNDVAY